MRRREDELAGSQRHDHGERVAGDDRRYEPSRYVKPWPRAVTGNSAGPCGEPRETHATARACASTVVTDRCHLSPQALQPPAAAGSRPAADPSDQGLYAPRRRARHVPGKKRVRGVSEAPTKPAGASVGDPKSTDLTAPVTLDRATWSWGASTRSIWRGANACSRCGRPRLSRRRDCPVSPASRSRRRRARRRMVRRMRFRTTAVRLRAAHRRHPRCSPR